MIEGKKRCGLTDSYGQENLDAKVLSVLHELTVDKDLVGSESVSDRVGGVGGLGDLDLSPLLVGRDLKERSTNNCQRREQSLTVRDERH